MGEPEGRHVASPELVAPVPAGDPKPFANLQGPGCSSGQGKRGRSPTARLPPALAAAPGSVPPGMPREPQPSPFPRRGGEGTYLGALGGAGWGALAVTGRTCASVDLQPSHPEVAGGAGVDAHAVLADAVPPDEQEEPVVAGDAAVVLRAQDAARAVLQQAGARCRDKRRRGAAARLRHMCTAPGRVPAPWQPLSNPWG